MLAISAKDDENTGRYSTLTLLESRLGWRVVVNRMSMRKVSREISEEKIIGSPERRIVWLGCTRSDKTRTRALLSLLHVNDLT